MARSWWCESCDSIYATAPRLRLTSAITQVRDDTEYAKDPMLSAMFEAFEGQAEAQQAAAEVLDDLTDGDVEKEALTPSMDPVLGDLD